MFDWALKCFRHYVDFSGRAQKKEFWYFQLCQILISIIINGYAIIILQENTESSLMHTVSLLFFCIFFLPDMSVTVRRLHDIGKTGWWAILKVVSYLYLILIQLYVNISIFIALIEIVSVITLIIFCCIDTEEKENQWGLPAK